MIYSENNSLQSVCLHIVGNKSLDEGIQLSESPMEIDPSLLPILTRYFISSFKSDERYSLYHHSGLEFNFVYQMVSTIFDNPSSLYDASVSIAKQLYDNSEHNMIKEGELCVAYFKEVEVDGKNANAVGIFKSETKDTYLRVVSHNGNNGLEKDSGINVNKLDKGCLIFNLDKDEGYVLAIIDGINRTEAKYWVEDFLQARPKVDEYYHTRTFLSATKGFIIKSMPKDVTKGEKAELMDKTLRYFQENETFDMGDFSSKVMGDEQLSSDFGAYMGSFWEKNDREMPKQFTISESAVKKSSRSMKSIIKLDKNFHIYVHGGEGLIKKGYDPETGMAFYQLFFKEEG